VSLPISKLCSPGFAIYHLFLVLLDNSIALQGDRVLEDREVRQPFVYVTEGAPQRRAAQSIIKYTGKLRTPEWMDIEQGSVPVFNDFTKGTQVKKKSSRYCVVYRQTSPLLHTRQGMNIRAQRPTHGASM
jgi:hypothetical protein